ncbi:MAG: pyridoxal phosphate-dependent aminotransferase [Oscillospiraceae bacterium]|nr:pyridoxal phosphate-dependent aminotransferase [Oscillospiraceae bacterium]
MISEKMIKLTQGNSVIRAMFEEGKKLAAIHGHENVYDFSLGNPSIPSPSAVNAAIIDIVQNEDPISLHGYMSNIGYPEVREEVALSLNKKFDTKFDKNNIIMSVGAAGGLNVVLKTLINPGDEVIVISPFFVEYGNYVNNYDGKLVIVPACRMDFRPNPETLLAAVTKKTKAVILNSPNNPTGVVYPEETIKALAEVLEKKSKEYGSPIYIISDEPYRELVYDGINVPFIPNFYKNTIVCYSWSKSLSLPGQRIGYIALPGDLDDFDLIFDAASIATRILGYVNAPALIQRVVSRCLDEQTDIDAYDANRKLLYNGLKDLGIEAVYPQGAFYLWLKTPGSDKEFITSAKKYNLLMVPGSAFTSPGYARIAYCVSYETIERSLPAFKKLAEELKLIS